MSLKDLKYAKEKIVALTTLLREAKECLESDARLTEIDARKVAMIASRPGGRFGGRFGIGSDPETKDEWWALYEEADEINAKRESVLSKLTEMLG